MGLEISGPLQLSLPQSIVEIVNDENDENDDLVTPVIVRPFFTSKLVSSRPRKKSRKDRYNRIHSLVPLSRPDIKEEYLVDDIIPAENTVARILSRGG